MNVRVERKKLLEPTLTELPHGPHGLARDLVTGSQRQRLLFGVTVVVADRGYPNVTVADIAAAAKVSRRTFYQHFPDKEACFLAAAETGRDLMIEHLEQVMRQVFAEPVEPFEALRRGIREYLTLLRDEPSFARSFYLETAVVGSRAIESFGRCQRWFAGFIRSWREAAGPVGPPVPDYAYLAVTDATNEAVRRTLRAGGDLLELEDTVMYIHRALLGLAMPVD
ncbi:TetR/AcrR family transcriptional regulator [Nocardia abscessus]|uniref:TetR/AcrR family transcriptional regulator n=1 Tax=Nocardia abscessus TaxID=120957 RepID=UPI002456A975|nr:TetR/AcrR family transcriptional regulator [Nocardia abscessus]